MHNLAREFEDDFFKKEYDAVTDKYVQHLKKKHKENYV